MIKDHAVVILASGLSQRLGQSKQLLSKNGEPLICYMIKLALATNPHVVVVVIPEGQPKVVNAVSAVISESDSQSSIINMKVNPIPETGMAHSLYLGIEALTKLSDVSINRVLIMGVDQVLLDSTHLINLLACEHTVVASSYPRLNEDHLNEPRLDKSVSKDKPKENIVGLPIVINYELLKQWQSALTGDKGLRHLIRALPSNQISTVINHQLSHDIDTPKQLAHAKQQNWLDS